MLTIQIEGPMKIMIENNSWTLMSEHLMLSEN